MKFLKNCHPKRFAKFSIVGSLNFLVDVIILNSLSYATGVNRGIFAAVFSAISFLVANVNSYYLNKKWTFRDNEKKSRYKVFLLISVIGTVINMFIIYNFTTISQPYFSDIIWLNISKIIATSLVIFFNYYGYKKYVFNKD